MCGATWQQSAGGEAEEKKRRFIYLTQWTFFWSIVFVSIFSLFFARNALVKIWPPIGDFYEALQGEPTKSFAIQNISNFFVVKKGGLYMGLKGELINVSDKARSLPSVTISLTDDENINKESPYQKVWTHNLTYEKLLPNQKVAFETELQKVPYNNLICDIKLDALQ
jgi:hypothetical protein